MIGNDAGELPRDVYGETALDRLKDHAENGTMPIQLRNDLRTILKLATTSASAGVLVEALTPSAATKAAYIGEFGFNIVDRDEDGDEIYRRVLVPWDTIKEIMAAIAARQALSTTPTPASDGVMAAAKALFEHEMRCRQVTASWDDVDEDDRRGWQQSVDVVFAATPDRFGEGYRAGEWQDIASAPTDGTEFVGWGKPTGRSDEGAYVTRWQDYGEGSPALQQWREGKGPKGTFWHNEPVHNWSNGWSPTRWYPLPAIRALQPDAGESK